jgi:hypothetical protein
MVINFLSGDADSMQLSHKEMDTSKRLGHLRAFERPYLPLFTHTKLAVLVLACLVLFVGSFVSAQKSEVYPKDVITADLLKSHIGFLASDALAGRATPSAGLDTGAAYIARKFKQLGLEPFGGTYFHSIGLCKARLAENNSFALSTPQGVMSYELKSGYIPFEMTGDTMVDASLVFVGYGISAPQFGYDDYQNVDVKGKVVVLLTHSPLESKTAKNFLKLPVDSLADLHVKVAAARKHGAVGVIVLTDPLNHKLLVPKGYTWPGLSKFIPAHIVANQTFTMSDRHIPVIHGSENVMMALFGSVDALKEIQKGIDAALKPNSFDLAHMRANISTHVLVEPIKADNVLAVLPGTDLATEYVVVGAHYDHIGQKTRKKDSEEDDVIYNGADDNASGSAGVLAVAEAFAKSGVKPRRSVVFALFAGEELGLVGSSYLLKKPVFPFYSTIAMLNMDMISRGGPDSLSVEGSGRTPELRSLIEDCNKPLGLKLANNTDDGFGGSDHQPFLDKGIPAVHFFTGLHKDYHQVSDNPDLADAAKAAKVAQLVFQTAVALSGTTQKLTLNPESD